MRFSQKGFLPAWGENVKEITGNFLNSRLTDSIHSAKSWLLIKKLTLYGINMKDGRKPHPRPATPAAPRKRTDGRHTFNQPGQIGRVLIEEIHPAASSSGGSNDLDVQGAIDTVFQERQKKEQEQEQDNLLNQWLSNIDPYTKECIEEDEDLAAMVKIIAENGESDQQGNPYYFGVLTDQKHAQTVYDRLKKITASSSHNYQDYSDEEEYDPYSPEISPAGEVSRTKNPIYSQTLDLEPFLGQQRVLGVIYLIREHSLKANAEDTKKITNIIRKDRYGDDTDKEKPMEKSPEIMRIFSAVQLLPENFKVCLNNNNFAAERNGIYTEVPALLAALKNVKDSISDHKGTSLTKDIIEYEKDQQLLSQKLLGLIHLIHSLPSKPQVRTGPDPDSQDGTQYLIYTEVDNADIDGDLNKIKQVVYGDSVISGAIEENPALAQIIIHVSSLPRGFVATQDAGKTFSANMELVKPTKADDVRNTLREIKGLMDSVKPEVANPLTVASDSDIEEEPASPVLSGAKAEQVKKDKGKGRVE